MRVLALDTSLDACSVALVHGDRVVAVCSEPMLRGHQERLAPMTAEVLSAGGLRVDDLDRIAVTIGPGSFTGLRVGLAFAKGLSLASDTPLVGVGVLAALNAAMVVQEVGTDALVAAVVDARQARVHLQIGVTAPFACADAEAVAHLDAAGVATLTGPAAARLAALGARVRVATQTAPDPIVVARLGRAVTPPPTEAPRLMYLRAPDARTLAERDGA